MIFGTKQESDLKELLPLVEKINNEESWAIQLSNEDFPRLTEEWKLKLKAGGSLETFIPRSFALAREAARRTLGERLYDVQLMGGLVLHQGRIMEMKTGEGKTLSCVPAAYLNSLLGHGVHVITVNDYLAERDALWMKPIYDLLGISVGYILGSQSPDTRKPAYESDITYGTNNEFGFDYLRDNMRYSGEGKMQRNHHYCIIDEIDSILIDEARTPLIISGSADDDVRKYSNANKVVSSLRECAKDPETEDYPEEPEGDYKIDEKSRKVSFTDQGLNRMEAVLVQKSIIHGSLFEGENFEYIHYVTQAVRSHRLFHKDTHYVVDTGGVQIVDEFTGRILHGRRYSDGLHQAIEAKEGIQIAHRNRTLATITFQNFFRMYKKISGMTGTAATEAKEFGKIYGLDVVVIPTNRPVTRDDADDLIFLDEKDKFESICDEIQEVNKKGQPILVGTVSIEKSETLSGLLTRRGVRHEVLNAKNHAREALIVAEAGAKGSITIATNMAGRGTDIKLGGNPDYRARRKAGTEASQEEFEKALKKEMLTWRAENEEVKTLGGLYIVGTERHESRRIDNQLRGRSGRQGDPGLSRFFLSMDDELMRLFGGTSRNLKGMMARVGMKPGEALNHPLLNRAIERAQNKVEERNFDIRKHLLEFDDVLNEQRKFIYQQREEILVDGSIKGRILRFCQELLEDKIEPWNKQRGKDPQLLNEILTELKDTLLWTPLSADELLELPYDQVGPRILEAFETEIRNKEDFLGAQRLNGGLRIEYLRTIDGRWQDHLENLEALREAVYLRSYAQKNPLLEYKIEGFQIFDELLYKIRQEVAQRLFLVKTEQLIDQNRSLPRVQGNTVHRQMGQFASPVGAQSAGGTQSGSSGGSQALGATSPRMIGGRMPGQTVAAPLIRQQPKVGRNDPCPCGSGKKYKHCHGA
ncbi:MAG: preprotein translocase subunit SecA [Spirochaetales bacterium]|nr:preprotein translocase subunit SecA [Spirochaetales bacterium]